MFKKITQRKILLLLVVIPLVVVTNISAFAPIPQQVKSTTLISGLIKNYHYNHPKLNDARSSLILDRYIESMDPSKHFFLASDIQSFEQYRYNLDNALKNADTDAAFTIYNTFRSRIKQRINYALEILEQEFDFTKDEIYRVDYEDAVWAQKPDQLNDLWYRRVKNDYLTLKLTGKNRSEIINTLKKRYQQIIRRADQQTAENIYQSFINAYTTSIDPHSYYFSPHNSENFNINMRLSLEGIGAVLRSKDEHTLVQRIIKGGPADLSNQLKARDKIIGVAQDQGEMIDTIGWRLQDVVELIRGPKGSVVRLLLQPYSSGVDGPSKEITLIRDTIKLEEQAAKSSTIKVTMGQEEIKIGVIDLPTFYMDFDARNQGKKDYRSTTRDVKKIISDLKSQHVDGIVIDLRANGGGSLSEATKLTGLFIQSGPVVQIKDTHGKIEVNKDLDDNIAYSGPLAVLVDQYSASASEIFAGAIQDYARGIIIGEPTFGKGTVQTLVNLNRFAQDTTDLGQLKITVAQFFRINDSSTQQRGIHPDIAYPTVISDAGQGGERSLDNALPWGKIAPADYEKYSPEWFNLKILRNKHQSRIADDAGFTYLIDNAKSINHLQNRKTISLSEDIRRNERDNRLKHALNLENKFRLSRGLKLLTLQDKNKDEDDEPVNEQKDNDPILKIQLDEAANILADHILIQRENLTTTQILQ